MKTPDSFQKNIKQGIITKDILEACLYSVNKRAKNHRDNKRKYRQLLNNNRYLYFKIDYDDISEQKEQEYYQMKEELLKVLKPVCIHREHLADSRKFYIYETDENWENRNQYTILDSGTRKIDESDYDPTTYEVIEKYKYVQFVFVEDKTPQYNYYLFYDFGSEHTYHTPIKNPEEYRNLPIIDLKNKLTTCGKDTKDLISVQFVRETLI